MAMQHCQGLGRVAVLGIQLGDGLEMRLTRQRMHGNVAGGGTSSLVVRLDAPDNAGAVPRSGHQVRAAVIQGYARNDVQMTGDRSQGLSLVDVVDSKGVIPDATGVEQLAIRAHRKELGVWWLGGMEGTKHPLAVSNKIPY